MLVFTYNFSLNSSNVSIVVLWLSSSRWLPSGRSSHASNVFPNDHGWTGYIFRMECGRYPSYLSGLNLWPLHRSSLFSSLYWFCRFIKCKYFLDRDSEIVGHIKHEFCGRTAFAQLNAADSAGIISSVHGKLLLGDFSLCPYSLKIINYFHLITSFVIIH